MKIVTRLKKQTSAVFSCFAVFSALPLHGVETRVDKIKVAELRLVDLLEGTLVHWCQHRFFTREVVVEIPCVRFAGLQDKETKVNKKLTCNAMPSRSPDWILWTSCIYQILKNFNWIFNMSNV